jgi:hypothetical protein
MRKQYFFRPSPGGFSAWDVERLIQLTESFPRRRVALSEIRELSGPWFGSDEAATWVALVEHVKLMDAADPSFPIILAADGTVMDGMHRVAKALLAGQTDILAVQFTVDPPPNHVDVRPADLPYEESPSNRPLASDERPEVDEQ